jgi:hypothetical protein
MGMTDDARASEAVRLRRLGASIDDTAQRLGVGSDELQAFQYAAKLSGASIEDANTGLKFFQKNLGEAADKGGDAAAAFSKLGVNIRDGNGNVGETLDLLSGVAEGFSRLKTPAEKTTVAMQLFGRGGAALIPLLNQGQAGVKQLYAEFQRLGGGLDQSTIKALAEADDELDRLDFATKGLKGQLVAALVPALKSVVEWVTGAVGSFREFASQSYIVQSVVGTLTAAAVVAGVAWAVLNFEIALVVLALALLALAIDDVYTWMQGGDSVIGRFIDSLFGEGKSDELLKSVKQTYYEISDAIEDAGREAKGLWFAIRDLGDAIGVTFEPSVFDSWIATIKFMTRLVVGLVQAVTAVVRGVREAVQMLQGAGKTASSGPGGLAELLNDPAAAIREGLGVANVAPTIPASSSSTSNVQAAQNNDVKITINGVQDADGAGKAAGDAVSASLLGQRGSFASIAGGG